MVSTNVNCIHADNGLCNIENRKVRILFWKFRIGCMEYGKLLQYCPFAKRHKKPGATGRSLPNPDLKIMTLTGPVEDDGLQQGVVYSLKRPNFKDVE